MKKLTIYGFALFLLNIAPIIASSDDGGMDSGGGDAVALEFVQVARQIYSVLRRDYPKSLIEIDLGKFLTVINETKIETTEERLYLQNVEVDALNFPDEKKIIINRPRWASIFDTSKKVAFVFHEYLSILGIDDSRYQHSSSAELKALCDDELNSSLRREAERGNFDRVLWLLASGANPNAKDDDGNTALMLASYYAGDFRLHRLLIDYGADVNATNNVGWTPLFHAAGTLNYEGTSVLEFLLKMKGDVNHRDDNNSSPLLRALAIYGTTQEYRLKRAKLLIQAGAELNVQDNYGNTPLLAAASHEYLDVIRDLLSKRVNVRCVSERGESPILAAIAGHRGAETQKLIDIIDILIANGADVNIRNNFDDTALSLATRRGFLTIVEMLKKAGAKQ